MKTAKKVTSVLLSTALSLTVSFPGNVLADTVTENFDGDIGNNLWSNLMEEDISTEGDIVNNPFKDFFKEKYDNTFDGDVNSNPWSEYMNSDDDEDDGDVMENPWADIIVETTTQATTQAATTQKITTVQPTTVQPTTVKPTQAATTQKVTQAPTTVTKPLEVIGMVLSNVGPNKIGVVWGQDMDRINSGCLYNVYVNGNLRLSNVICNYYELDSVSAGNVAVTVKSTLNGIESDGITMFIDVEGVKQTTAQPTTVKQTTVQPTTVKPTQAATTQKITTVKPTTVKQTTVQPTTVKPTQTPTTQKVTQAPTTQAPTTEFNGDVNNDPWSEYMTEDTDFDGDVVENPWGDEFETQAPTTVQPTTQQPTTQQTTTQEETEFNGDVNDNPWFSQDPEENDGDVYENPWKDEYANNTQISNSAPKKNLVNSQVNQISDDGVSPVAMLTSVEVKKTTAVISGAKDLKNDVKISLKKINGVKGYQIQIAKKFKKKAKIYSMFSKKTSFKIKKKKIMKKLKIKKKALKKVFFRVRVYIESNGVKVYGKWSKKRKLK